MYNKTFEIIPEKYVHKMSKTVDTLILYMI